MSWQGMTLSPSLHTPLNYRYVFLANFMSVLVALAVVSWHIVFCPNTYGRSRNDLTTGVSRVENPLPLNPFPWARLWLRSSFPLSTPKEPSSLLPPSSPQSSATGGRPRTPRIPKEYYSTPDIAEKGNLDFEPYFVDTNKLRKKITFATLQVINLSRVLVLIRHASFYFKHS